VIVPVPGLLREPPDPLKGREVGGEEVELRGPGLPPDLGEDGAALPQVPAMEEDPVAQPGEGSRGGLPDPVRGAGHEDGGPR